MFLQGFSAFLPGLKPKAKISKNIDFAKEELIFSRVQRFKISQTSPKTRSWRSKLVFGGQKLAMMSILAAKKTILAAKMAILEAKKAILEAKMAILGPDLFTMRIFRLGSVNGGGL